MSEFVFFRGVANCHVCTRPFRVMSDTLVARLESRRGMPFIYGEFPGDGPYVCSDCVEDIKRQTIEDDKNGRFYRSW